MERGAHVIRSDCAMDQWSARDRHWDRVSVVYPIMMDISALSPGAVTDIRATYGGFQIGPGVFLIWSALSPPRMLTGLFLLALGVGAVAGCRLIGVMLDGGLNSWIMIGLAYEFAVTTMALVGFLRVRTQFQTGMAP